MSIPIYLSQATYFFHYLQNGKALVSA